MADGQTLRENVLKLLNPNNPASQVYINMYIRSGGNMHQFNQDLNRIRFRESSFWDSLLFDIIPFVISDIYNQPLLIWQSYINSFPIVIIGPNSRQTSDINIEFIQIARNAALNHYFNIENDNSPNIDIQHKIKSPPLKKQKLIMSSKKKCHQFGQRVSGLEYMKTNNVYIKNKYDNLDFIWILYLCLICYQIKKKYYFQQLIKDNKINKLSRCIHYLLTKVTKRINKPTSVTKTRALHKAQKVINLYNSTLHVYHENLINDSTWFTNNYDKLTSYDANMNVCIHCGCNKLLQCQSNPKYVICSQCHSFFKTTKK